MTEDDRAVPLAEVVGMNARKIRGDRTADDLATAARDIGLNWGTGRISDLEAGRVSPTLTTLVVLAEALGRVRGERVKLSELVSHPGFVSLTKELAVSGKELMRFVAGDPVEIRMSEVPGGRERMRKTSEVIQDQLDYVSSLNPKFADAPWGVLDDVQRRSGEAEARMAKSLGVQRFVLDYVSAHLWEGTVSDERDRRAGSPATAQKRGQVSRQLKAELQKVISDGDG